MLLADISDELKKPIQREWALQKVIEIDSVNIPLAYKLLASSYFERGAFNKALVLYYDYAEFEISKDSSFISNKIIECINANRLLEKKYNLDIIHLDSTVNTIENEYWPFVSADDSILYFTRLITTERRYVFERLFYTLNTKSTWSQAQKLAIGNNTEVNEGTLSMTADSRFLFFTACGKYDGFGSCDIYYMLKENGEWLSPKNAGRIINTPYWDAQPSISINGDYLFWSSNRPGGFGAKDIWVSKIDSIDGGYLVFNKPINLGSDINSIKDDYSPFIHADGETLYFASEGGLGLGKSDLYYSRFNNGKWSKAQNLGYPINSINEDDGIVVSPTAHLSFLSSNRKPSIGNSKDIFQFELPEEFLPQKMGYLKGSVFDISSNEKLNVKIELTELGASFSRLIHVDNEIGYITTLAQHKTYAFNIATPGYLFYSKHFDLTESKEFVDATVYDIYLEPIEMEAKVILKNVFFDIDSFQLKEESTAELNNVIGFMKMNPTVKIEISGHTDNTGNNDYNQSLSENRAKVISEYLNYSIDSNRIIYKGFGARFPVDSNDNEQGRGNNRRSELTIIAF